MNFYNFGKINQKYISFLKKDIVGLINSGYYISGKNVKRFERDFSRFIGTKYAVGVGNGYDALRLSIEILMIKKLCSKGDDVIVPANTYIATILPIVHAGLNPIFVEPESNYFDLDLNLLKKKITKNTKIIMVTHLYGHVANIKNIIKFAKNNKLRVIEDCSQSHGATIEGKQSGSFGDMGCFSLFPGKNLGAVADAGIITTNNKNFYNTLISIRNYGEQNFSNLNNRKYKNIYLGHNSRMDEINASLLIRKLKYLNKDNTLRRKYANYFLNNIKNSKIELPKTRENTQPVWHQFIIKTKKREKLIRYLKKFNIETRVFYPIPPHKQPCLKKYRKLKLPLTEKIHKENLALPVNIHLKFNEIKRIVEIINDY
jgi:dTDP-4-amino-4,6-dideoxygalactose transaminase